MAQNAQTQSFDLPLPLMYVDPHRSLTSAYVSADVLDRFEALRQQVTSLGVTLSLLYTYWDPARLRFFGTLVLDQTDAKVAPRQIQNALTQVPGVTVLSTEGPGSGLAAFAKNELNVAGTPVVVIAQPFLGGTHRKLVESLGDQAAQILFQSGQDAGTMAASGVPDLVKNLGVQLSPDLIRQRFFDLQVFGWATVVELRANDQFTGEALLADDFEAAAWQGQATGPVCHWIRGFITGALSSLTGHAIQVNETECQGKGDRYCRMTFQRA